VTSDITLGIVALLGTLTGALAVLAFRTSERLTAAAPPRPEPELPPGAATVLSALSSMAVVLDESDRVVKATPTAHAAGLVRGQRLVPDQLVALARSTRRDGGVREAELEIPRGPLGSETLAVSARVAALGARLVLVLVEDRTDARRVDAVRRDFVANVSHELKTPVGALSLLAEAVVGASDDPEAVRRFAGRMQNESARLTNLVQELIDLSRLQGEDPLASAVPVDVDAVIAEAVDRSRALAAARAIEIMAGGDRGLRVLGDPDQLVMALGNLVENAVNYSADRTRIAVGVRRAGDVVEMTVTDQGIGIPERDLERVFERFYRVDPARSRATGGTGLGLSIVKHVAHNHGGEVTVWSAEGAGSTFTLRLPLAAAAPVRDPSQDAAPRAATRPVPSISPAVAPAAGANGLARAAPVPPAQGRMP